MRKTCCFVSVIIICVLAITNVSESAGPLLVNKNGEVVVWDTDQPVLFTPDQGRLGLFSNVEAIKTTSELFGIWENIPTSSITFEQDGQLNDDIDGRNILSFLNSTGSDMSPIIFDDDGSIIDALNGVGANEVVIGSAGINSISVINGVMKNIVSGLAIMNGRFFDGLSKPDDLLLEDFRGTFAHEFGHFIGLGHTQINMGQLTLHNPDNVPLMFPVSINGIGETVQIDDVASVSSLYPASSFNRSSAVITGRVFLEDGVTQFQGANVIARNVSNPDVIAISSVSGFLHIDPADPDSRGSNDSSLIGFYEIRGLEAGDYIVVVEQIDPSFSGGSRVGPLDNPVPLPFIPESYNDGESNSDIDECASVISVSPGEIVQDIDFIINDPGGIGRLVREQEPDNNFLEAQAVTFFTSVSGEIDISDKGSVSLKGDDFEDFYSFTVNTGQFISTFLSFQDDRANLELAILDAKLNIYGLSRAGEGTSESIGPVKLPPGTYFVGVSAVDGIINPPTEYTLDITSICIGDGSPSSTPAPTPTQPVPANTPIHTPVGTPVNEGKQAKLEIRFEPNPVIESSKDQWKFNVFVNEVNGVGVTITSFDVKTGDGDILFEGDTKVFSELFILCDDPQNGFIPGLGKACTELIRNGKPGTDVFTLSGLDENGNNIKVSGSVVLEASGNKSFTFECAKSFEPGSAGLETLRLDLDEDEACTLKLTDFEPGVVVEISTKLRKGIRSAIKVDPVAGVTNEKGELEVSIRAVKRGVDWIAWAIKNDKGRFEFNKKAYDSGLAWGMFVEVK